MVQFARVLFSVGLGVGALIILIFLINPFDFDFKFTGLFARNRTLNETEPLLESLEETTSTTSVVTTTSISTTSVIATTSPVTTQTTTSTSTTTTTVPKSDHVVFSEVFYDTEDDSVEEWIELYNPTLDDIDLSGLTIEDNDRSYSVPNGIMIASKDSLVIARDETGFENLYEFLPDLSDLTLRLNDNGDELKLKNGSDEIDMVAWEDYVSEWGIKANEGESIQRDPPNRDSDTENDWIINDDPEPEPGGLINTTPTNQPPVANAGSDQIVNDTDGTWEETVTLNGSSSYDPDGEITAYEWKEGTNVLGEIDIISPSLDVGTHEIILIVTDDQGATGSDTVTVTVNPNQTLADHVVISEVYYDVINESCSEFVELYNPTENNVNIGGWVIATSISENDATIPSNSSLKPYGFYLIADDCWQSGKDNPTWSEADHNETITLKNDDGWVILKDNLGATVDTVGWGSATNYEGNQTVDVNKGESLERRPGDSGSGNGWDSDNNSIDFVLRNLPEPQNSNSDTENPG